MWPVFVRFQTIQVDNLSQQKKSSVIKLFGKVGTSEYDAGNYLKRVIEKNIPDSKKSNSINIAILPSATCHGQKVRDIDILLLAHFEKPIKYTPGYPFQNPYSNELELPEEVLLESICVVIELKDHLAKQIKFQGKDVLVNYRGHWHNVSSQSHQQVYSLKNYLKAHRIRPPFITNLIWLRNIQNSDLPQRPHNIISGDVTWGMFLNTITQVRSPRRENNSWTQTANYTNATYKKISDLFSKELVPTKLDRQRMENINAALIETLEISNNIGVKALFLRGRGGTGKTIRLLQIAKKLYEEKAARILILTYNKALVADLRRLMTLLGVVDEAAMQSIRIQTIHSFLFSLLSSLGIYELGEKDFLEQYDDLKSETLQLLEVDAITQSDIKQIKETISSDLIWDYVLIDEAQDWPEDESRILSYLFDSNQLVIADGVDQLVRQTNPTDWTAVLGKQNSKFISLKKCLRMKAGLTRFVSSFAGHLGLQQSDWIANEEIPGGKIIILDGIPASEQKAVFSQLIRENKDAGNKPVDMLLCTPPKFAKQNIPAKLLDLWGYQIWDGTDYIQRGSYPTDVNQLRIVQYESCRGLEGWITINYGLDEFFDYKFSQLQSGLAPSDNMLVNDPDRIRLLTAKWVLIALTRAMDTLVIQISNKDSIIRDALIKTVESHQNYVIWLDEFSNVGDSDVDLF